MYLVRRIRYLTARCGADVVRLPSVCRMSFVRRVIDTWVYRSACLLFVGRDRTSWFVCIALFVSRWSYVRRVRI